ncbi:MAG TPA: Xaa-Pro peptidase family protein [Thermohalobaculum sp.]|nr:Xaa-Pro peptidase family protein [Thermohalobaculum sp.]
MTDDRLAPIRAVAEAAGLDAIALVPGANFRRLFGRDFHQNERPLVVVIPVEGPPAAVVPDLELNGFAQVRLDGEVIPWRDQDGYAAAFDRLGRVLSPRRIGVEGQQMRVFVQFALMRAFPGAEIVDAHLPVSALRLRKTPSEIASMRQAIAVTERAFAGAFGEVRAGLTEAQVESILLRRLFEEGAEDIAFQPIVAAGTNSAMPHAKARRDYAIRPGDALLFDFGARIDGICADLTRTVFVGHVDDADAAFYENVQAANAAGCAASGPGATAHQVDDAATSVLESGPYARFIRAKTGHGLGLDIHEAPYIMRGNHVRLEPGMVFTVEPGLYDLDRLGVRIEDDILITETGAESLTSYPRELTLVGTG